MSLLMMLASSGGIIREPIAKTFIANETWPAPAGVVKLETLEGYGARGENSQHIQSWRRDITITYVRRDGGPDDVQSGGSQSGSGPIPRTNYCDASMSYTVSESAIYSSSQVCYSYVSTSTTIPATKGASASGFGKTFPGSTGDVAPPVTKFADVAIAPGTSYSIIVPSGGSITITYYG